MPRFEIETPQGRFEVEAPDEQSALEAIQQMGAAPQSSGFMRSVDDFGRGIADMTSFGFADEVSAGLGAATGVGGEFGDYEGNLEAQRQRDREGGWARFGGQVLGALALPAAGAKTVLGAVGQGIGAGGLYGYGSGEGGVGGRLRAAGIGATVGGIAGGAVRTGLNALQSRAAAKTIPDVPALRKTAEAGYRAADDAAVIVKPEGMRRIGTAVVGDLADMGYLPANEPKISALLAEIERLGNTPTTFKGLQAFRRQIGNVAASNVPSERAMAMRIMHRLDDYLADIPAKDVITGNVGAASRGFKQGQENWARMRRAEMVDTARIKAERRAASTGTGGNAENAMRQNVRAILDNPKRSRGMTQAELDMADKVVSGSRGQNVLRHVGKLSPTTGGLQGAFTVGATALNPAFAIPAAAGYVAKTAAEAMTARNVARLSQMIRSGGKTAKELAKLAKGGQLSIPEVRRLEGLAKVFGVSVPTLAAAAADQIGKATAR